MIWCRVVLVGELNLAMFTKVLSSAVLCSISLSGVLESSGVEACVV
jgi:hypothetical protein